MRINISSLAGNATVLAGTEQGRRVLTQLVDTVREPESAAPMFFDFSGVTVATASFLREGPLEYRRLIRSRSSKLYPIVANASDEILEELGLFLESQNDAIFACTLSDAGAVSGRRLIGSLEEKQASTLQLVTSAKEVDASTLARSGHEQGVKATAWNNRLAALALKGLVTDAQQGRTKRYRLAVEED